MACLPGGPASAPLDGILPIEALDGASPKVGLRGLHRLTPILQARQRNGASTAEAEPVHG
jgi:hypothetical protein